MGDKILQMWGFRVKRGGNLQNQHYYRNYSVPRSENQPKCSTDELKGLNESYWVLGYPKSDLAPLMGDKILQM